MDRVVGLRADLRRGDDVRDVYAAEALEHGLSEFARQPASGGNAGVVEDGAQLMRDAKPTPRASPTLRAAEQMAERVGFKPE